MRSIHKRALQAGVVAAVVAVTLTACSGGGQGGDKGAKAVTGNVSMIVPFAAGGGSDASGRAIAGGLEKSTGLTITTENREGGSGAVGYNYFLGQEGKANTLLAAETSLLSIPLSQDVEFTHEDFTPIMKLGDDYTLMVVPADSEYKTCDEVVAAAKDDRVVAAVSGAVSLDEIVFSLVEKDQHVEFDRVPFESGAEVITGLLGGQVDVASLNPGEVLGQLESGDLRALCAFSEEPYEYEEIADVPTAKEQGIDVAFAQFRGFIAPGGISKEETKFWVDAAKKFEASDAYTSYIEDNLLQPNAMYGDDFADYLAEGDKALAEALDK